MTAPRPLGLGRTLVPWGTHLLGFFDSREALDLVALRVLEAGLAAGERALWVHAGEDRVRRCVERFGPLASAAAASGALTLAPFREMYVPGGAGPDAAALARRWRAVVAEATRGGFAGLHVFAEVDVRTPAELAQFLDCETEVGETLAGLPIVAACVYPRARMSAEALRRLRRSHDAMVPIPESPIALAAGRRRDRPAMAAPPAPMLRAGGPPEE